ncbi:MAG: choice-of-anchor C family protein [Chloroflexi bacterium]|nr:choice-of-anchor C family protein [Chloroflexota bacterium]
MNTHILPRLGLPIFVAASLLFGPGYGTVFSMSSRPQSVLGPDIIVNGNFETPDVTSETFDTHYAGQTFGGWNVEAGSVDHISERYWQAANGRQSVDLSGNTGSPGTISQLLLTSPLQTYILHFALSGNPEEIGCYDTDPIKRMEVWWDSTKIDTLAFDTTGVSNWNMGWGFHQYTITATNAISQLRFKSLTSTCHGPVLDMVSVQSYSGDFPLLDLPLDYWSSGRKFADVAQGSYIGGWVNSWLDHNTPDYSTNQILQIWNGTQLTSSDMIDKSNCSTPPGAYGKSCYDGHNGIDYQYQPNDTVYAAAPGKVVDLCKDYPCMHPQGVITSDPSYGKWVLIQHNQKYATFYAHLKSINPNLTVGTEITNPKAIPIGIIGNSGTKEIHLHFGVYYDINGNGKWEDSYQEYTEVIDPYGWFGPGFDPWSNPSIYMWKDPLWDRRVADSSGTLLVTPSGKGKVVISAGVLSTPLTFELWDSLMPILPANDLRAAGHTIQLKVLEWINGTSDFPTVSSINTGFPKPVNINIRYGTDEIPHLDTSKINIYRLDEISGSWVALPTSLNYTLKEANAQISNMGIFNLQAPLLCPTDHSEPNDTYNTSTEIYPNRDFQTYLFDIKQDTDWFNFKAVAGGKYTISTVNLSVDVDTLIEFYDQDTQTLLGTGVNDNISNTGSHLIWQAPSNGTYYLRVINPTTDSYGCSESYKLGLVQVFSVYLPKMQR